VQHASASASQLTHVARIAATVRLLSAVEHRIICIRQMATILFCVFYQYHKVIILSIFTQVLNPWKPPPIIQTSEKRVFLTRCSTS